MLIGLATGVILIVRPNAIRGRHKYPPHSVAHLRRTKWCCKQYACCGRLFAKIVSDVHIVVAIIIDIYGDVISGGADNNLTNIICAILTTLELRHQMRQLAQHLFSPDELNKLSDDTEVVTLFGKNWQEFPRQTSAIARVEKNHPLVNWGKNF